MRPHSPDSFVPGKHSVAKHTFDTSGDDGGPFAYVCFRAGNVDHHSYNQQQQHFLLRTATAPRLLRSPNRSKTAGTCTDSSPKDHTYSVQPNSRALPTSADIICRVDLLEFLPIQSLPHARTAG